MRTLRIPLVKSENVKHPGSRGGHPWWDGHDWRYDEPPRYQHHVEWLQKQGLRLVDHTQDLSEDDRERTYAIVATAVKRLLEGEAAVPGLGAILQKYPLTLDIHSALGNYPRADYDIAQDPQGARVNCITIADSQPFPFFSAVHDYYRYARRIDTADERRARDEATQDLLSRMGRGQGHAIPVETMKQEVYDIWAATPRGADETLNDKQAKEIRRMNKIIDEINATLPQGHKPVTLGTIIREHMGKSFRFFYRFGYIGGEE